MTRQGIIELALRRLAILSVDETVTADDLSYAGVILDNLFDELQTDVSVAWDLTAVPAVAAIPLANLLAADLGPHYTIPTEPRHRPYARLMAVLRPDNRDDSADLDGDGNVTQAEEDAASRARFY